MTNPLMASIKLPGRTFQLPSRGLLYRNGEVDNTEGEIHVHAMTALDEITMKNSDLLFNGTALDEVVAKCVPSIKNPSALYARDVDALMVFLRLVTYGPQFNVRVAHDCEQSKLKHKVTGEYKLDENGEHIYEPKEYSVNIEEFVLNMKYLEPNDVSERYKIVLDTGQEVRVNPVRYRDLIDIFQENMKRQQEGTAISADRLKETLIKHLVIMIDSVDGHTDKKDIDEWVRSLTTRQHNKLSTIIDRTSEWGPTNETKIKCSCCGELFPVELPLNPISFFTE